MLIQIWFLITVPICIWSNVDIDLKNTMCLGDRAPLPGRRWTATGSAGEDGRVHHSPPTRQVSIILLPPPATPPPRLPGKFPSSARLPGKYTQSPSPRPTPPRPPTTTRQVSHPFPPFQATWKVSHPSSTPHSYSSLLLPGRYLPLLPPAYWRSISPSPRLPGKHPLPPPPPPQPGNFLRPPTSPPPMCLDACQAFYKKNREAQFGPIIYLSMDKELFRILDLLILFPFLQFRILHF